MYSVQWGKSLFKSVQNSTGSCMLYNMIGSCWAVITEPYPIERISSLYGLEVFLQNEWQSLSALMGQSFKVAEWFTRLSHTCPCRYQSSLSSSTPTPTKHTHSSHAHKQTCKVPSHDWAGPVGVAPLQGLQRERIPLPLSFSTSLLPSLTIQRRNLKENGNNLWTQVSVIGLWVHIQWIISVSLNVTAGEMQPFKSTNPSYSRNRVA